MRRMGKKAQLTAIMIVGIVLLIAAGLVIYLLSFQAPRVEREAIQVPGELRPLHNYITECIRTTAIEGAYLAGTTGGYTTPPNTSLITDTGMIISFWYEQQKGATYPGKDVIEQELARWVDENLEACLNYTVFEQQGMQITSGDVNTTAIIAADELIFEVKYPVDVRVAQSQEKLEDYRVVLPHRMSYIYGSSVDMISRVVQDPVWIDLTELLEYDFDAGLIPINESVVVYAISDNASALRPGEPYIFMFATRVKVNHPPKLDLPERLVGYDNERFTYEIKADDPDGDNLIFHSNRVLFPIRENGKADFTPRIPGLWNVTITVEDPQGMTDQAVFEWLIIE